MKIISKIMISLAIFSYIALMVCVMTTSTYAWQNTNHDTVDIVTTGGQSYNITPIKAIYFTVPRSASTSEGFTNRSIQHQNVYTLEGKSNFQALGKVLSGRNTETQNNWSNIQFEDSDLNYRLTEDEWNRIGYLTTNTDDNTIPNTRGRGNEIGSCFDTFKYSTGVNLNYDEQRMGYIYQFADFVISKTMCEKGNVLTLRNYYERNTSISPNVQYSFELYTKTEDGGLTRQNINEGVLLNDYYIETRNINGTSYMTSYYTFDILQKINEYIPEDSIEYIQVANLQVNVSPLASQGSGDSASPLESVLNCTYFRPYATRYRYSGGIYDIDAWDSTNNPNELLAIDVRIRNTFNQKGMGVNLSGLDQLGGAVGNTVQGIFDVEIMPNITLWTILLIPLSLGIIFAVLRYFAGG